MSSPLVDWGKKIGAWVSKEDQPAKKIDPSWHAEMVKEANESFRKASSDPKLGGAKKATKKKTKKKAGAKR